MSTTETGWAIDRDYISREGDGTNVGLGGTIDDAKTGAAESVFTRQIYVRRGVNAGAIADPVRFRLLDDDGEIYYGGAISRECIDGEHGEEVAFAPLDWAQADSGCTEMQYHYGDGEWRTL